MKEIPYKGYLIRPAPLHLPDTDEWNIELYIEKDRGGDTKNRKFSAGDTFKTEEEAIRHCIHFGKQIIDGKSEKLTVADL